MRTSLLLSSIALFAALASAQHQNQPFHFDRQRQRRWVWGTSIIQDPTSGQDTSTLPPIGSNVNQFTTPAQTITTPNSTPTMPSFPPLESKSTSSAANSQSSTGNQPSVAQVGTTTTTPLDQSALYRKPFPERKSSSLAADSSQPLPTSTTTPPGLSATTAPPTSRAIGHRITTDTSPTSLTTPPPNPQPTTTPVKTHRLLWHERYESWLSTHESSNLGSKRDLPPDVDSTTTPTTPVGAYSRTTPDPETALHPPTFSGLPGTTPPGGVPGSYAISHLASSSSSTPTTPAQAQATGGVLDVVEAAVDALAKIVAGAGQPVVTRARLAKRKALSPSRFQVVIKRNPRHSTLHKRGRRTVLVE